MLDLKSDEAVCFVEAIGSGLAFNVVGETLGKAKLLSL